MTLPQHNTPNHFGRVLDGGQQNLACRLLLHRETALTAVLGISLKLLILPILFYLNWEFVSLFLDVDVALSNPFSGVFLLSGYVQHSTPDDPRYQKSWKDLLFLAYYVIFFSFVRQSILIYIARPLAKYFGLRRPAKVDRFGEQTYALIYFAVFGAWGYVCSSHLSLASSLTSVQRVMSSLPTHWYNTIEFWKG